MKARVGDAAQAPAFPAAARTLLGNAPLRRNVRHATQVIRTKRDHAVAEVPDWQALRAAGQEIKAHSLRYLDVYLAQFENGCTRAGGVVHWARDAGEASRIIVDIIRSQGATEVIKAKTMTSDEIGLNAALKAAGVASVETDLADLIVQLASDRPSHIVVPALHWNRAEVRRLFRERLGVGDVGDDPADLAEAARRYLRRKFLQSRIGLTGANFAIAETGSVCVVESEGNARMCLSLPPIVISLIGIEKIIPTFRDLEVFLQLLPRSATGERMNPYNSIWTGTTASDGPREFHAVLLDNGRTTVLADPAARETLHCIRCGACLNVCPVYRQTGGHAYGSVYSGPIGAILTPQLQAMAHSQSLPYASSLCGACYDVCPVRIDIPKILIHLRSTLVERGDVPRAERAAMKAASFAFASASRLSSAARIARAAQRLLTRGGLWRRLPGLRAWSDARDTPPVADESFREWWTRRTRGGVE